MNKISWIGEVKKAPVSATFLAVAVPFGFYQMVSGVVYLFTGHDLPFGQMGSIIKGE